MRLVYLSLCCTTTFVNHFHCSLLLAFSLHFSSSSSFLRSLFTQSSHLSCGLPRFLQPSYFFLSDLFGDLSSFILTMCPAHFIRLLTILPTVQALVPTSSLRSFVLLLSTLLTPAILLIQLFSHCSLCCCSLDRTTVSEPYVLAGTTLAGQLCRWPNVVQEVKLRKFRSSASLETKSQQNGEKLKLRKTNSYFRTINHIRMWVY